MSHPKLVLKSSEMKYRTSDIIVLALKIGLFLSLSIVFYVYYFQEVTKKYFDEATWVATTQQRLVEGVEPPFLTLCLAGPIAKTSVLKKYNMSVNPLNEPNLSEQKILKSLNKTVHDFYREAVFHLNHDFKLYMSFTSYGVEGLKYYKTELSLGKNIDSTLQVSM